MRVRAFTQDDAHIFCTEDQLAAECHKINELILSVYQDFGFDKIVVKLSTRPEKRVGADAMWDHAEAVMTPRAGRDQGAPRQRRDDRAQSRRGRLLRAEVRICAARRDRPRLAMRHDAGRLQSARALRRLLHRAQQREDDAGDGASRDLRLDGALHRHPAGTSRGPSAAVARAACRSSSARSRRRPTNTRWRFAASARRSAACASRRTCATRRSTTRCASIRWRRFPCCIAVGRKEASENTVSFRRLGSNAQTTMGAEAALEALASEAVPPDLRG